MQGEEWRVDTTAYGRKPTVAKGRAYRLVLHHYRVCRRLGGHGMISALMNARANGRNLREAVAYLALEIRNALREETR